MTHLQAGIVNDAAGGIWPGGGPGNATGGTTLATQVIVRDTFTRANAGTLGANWTANSGATTTGAIGITSNAAKVVAIGGNANSFYSASSFRNDQYSQVIAGGSATGTNSHICGVSVRGSAGDNYYRFTWNMLQGAGTLGLSVIVAGAFTALATAASDADCVIGCLLRMEVVGNVFNCYVNGALKITFTDTNNFLTSGAPGVASYMQAASPTSTMTNWEGGDLLWTRRGTVEPAASNAQEASVIYEGNAQILSGNVFKMWYTSGWITPVAVVNYAESADGITWTEYGSNPVISNGVAAACHGRVFKIGSTYYGYIGTPNPATALDQWTSSNGITWVKANASVIATGSGWEAGSVNNPSVWIEAGTWYMLYEGGDVAGKYSIGLATSADGITWSKYLSNPVISNGAGSVSAVNLYKLASTYYAFTHISVSSNLPSDIAIYSSTDLHTWTASSKNPIYERVLKTEGVNVAAGQIADACLIEVAGTTYMFHDATDAQAAGHIHINLATMAQPLSQIVLALM